MSPENVEAIRAALNARFPVLVSMFDEHAEFHAPDWGLDTGVYRGPTAITNWLRQWIDTWDGYESQARECIDAGSHVVVEQVQRGSSKETGLRLDARHWSVITLRDGKIVCWRCYQARVEALEAVGLRE
jgi:ketosteroid isomerase-like protein